MDLADIPTGFEHAGDRGQVRCVRNVRTGEVGDILCSDFENNTVEKVWESHFLPDGTPRWPSPKRHK